MPHDPSAGAAQDRHEGYYYPKNTSQENYGARARQIQDASRRTRIGFVTQLTKQQMAAAHTPQYAIFAKGTEVQKMIIVALNDDVFATLYRACGVLVQLTAQARTTQFFQDARAEGILTFPIC